MTDCITFCEMGNCVRRVRRQTPAAVFLQDTIKKLETRGSHTFTDYFGRVWIVTCSEFGYSGLHFAFYKANTRQVWGLLALAELPVEQIMLDGWILLSNRDDTFLVGRDFLLQEARTHASYRMFFETNSFMIPSL